jgi:phage terminase small subunit
MSKSTRGGVRRGPDGKPLQGRKPGTPNKQTVVRKRGEAIALKRAVDKSILSAEAVLEETRLLGFSNMLDYIRIGDDGLPYCDFSKLTREQAAAIGEIRVETRTEYETDAAGEKIPVPVREVRFKLASKMPALTKLGEHFRLWKQVVEHSGPEGGAIQHEHKNMTSIELARRFEDIVSEAAKARPAATASHGTTTKE